MFDRGYNPPLEAQQLLRILAERFTDPDFFPRLDGTASLPQLGQLTGIYEAIRPSRCQPLQVSVAWAAEHYLTCHPSQMADGHCESSYPPAEGIDGSPSGAGRVPVPNAIVAMRQLEEEIIAQAEHRQRIQLIRAKLITGFLAFVLVPAAGPDELPDVLHLVEEWVGAVEDPHLHRKSTDPTIEVQAAGGSESAFLATALGLSVCCAYHRLRSRNCAA